MTTAFQSNAFQNNAFQIDVTTPAPPASAGWDGTTILSDRKADGGSGYNKRELDAFYDAWQAEKAARNIKKKRVQEAVAAAATVIAAAESGGILDVVAPLERLTAALEKLPKAKPSQLASAVRQIERATAALERLIEDEEITMLLLS